MDNKNKKKSDNLEEIDPYEVLNRKFTDLSYRMHNICEDNPAILAKLIFDLVDETIPNDRDWKDESDAVIENIKTVEQVEHLIDLIVEKSKSHIH